MNKIVQDSQGWYWILEECKPPYRHYIIVKKYGELRKGKNGELIGCPKHFEGKYICDREVIKILHDFVEETGDYQAPMLGK